jgi:hypothetical protein
LFLFDFLESDGNFTCKSGKINKPSSISIDEETPFFCLVLLSRAASSRASLEKSTRPLGWSIGCPREPLYGPSLVG